MKLRQYLLAVMLGGTMSVFAQMDYTQYITNASFEDNGLDGWVVSGLSAQSNSLFVKDGAELRDGKVYAEKWVSSGNSAGSASAKQIVKSLPLGKYTLTVAAQNLDQSNKTRKCTGAYIYAGKTTNKTIVYTPDNYSVDFSCSTGEVEIGFVASAATGNWLSVDNFRIIRNGNLDRTELQTAFNTLFEKAKSLQGSIMSKEATSALSSAIVKGNAITDSSTDDEMTETATALSAAISTAQASVDEFSALSKNVVSAEPLLAKYMQSTVFTALQMAINNAMAVSNETTDAEVKALAANLSVAVDEANVSVAGYTKLNTAIVNAETAYSSEKNDAEIFLTAITEAKTMYDAKDADATVVTQMAESLTLALLAFNVANSTAGTGTPVSVTSTYKYVPTGATEALMRFTYAGSNILESGVCWSTERNPTVLDSRTKDYWTNNGRIYHITGLKTATVYYLRPYVMNKTYQVAYGDEVKIVTHPKGTCTGSWNNGAPTKEANDRCRNAIKETIEYFNEWTGIKGFALTGNYGADTPTADCSYGGWMRIGPNASNQAIGTVIHETGHGVGVGTSSRYADSNVHSWKWYGREANRVYSFLENKEANPYTSDYCMVGDGTHAWGQDASKDWFVNGSWKDEHIPLQYAGGCILLYGMFVDGLNPTGSYKNGLPGYTYNFDDGKKYYIMCKDESRGLNTALVGVMEKVYSTTTLQQLKLRKRLEDNPVISDEDAWNIEYDANTGYYRFKNVQSGRYLTHSATGTSMSLLAANKTPGTTENVQLMPDRTDITIGEGDRKTKVHGYWFTWNDLKSMEAVKDFGSDGTATLAISSFNYADTATKQHFIILSEDELRTIYNLPISGDVNGDGVVDVSDINAIIAVICGTSDNQKADINKDGNIDVSDVNAVISVICGK